jgi:hypothetical protein
MDFYCRFTVPLSPLGERGRWLLLSLTPPVRLGLSQRERGHRRTRPAVECLLVICQQNFDAPVVLPLFPAFISTENEYNETDDCLFSPCVA